MANDDTSVGRRELARVAEHVLKPAVRNHLDKLDEAGWKQLEQNLQGFWEGSERLIDRFGNRLEPSQLELLMDIQQSAQSALTFWRTFPDLVGVPERDLSEEHASLRRSWYDLNAKDLQELLEHARKLLVS
jgi:hypothetical protein